MRALRRLFFLYKPIVLSGLAIVGSILGFIFVVYPAVVRTVDRIRQIQTFSTAIADFRSKSGILAGLSEALLRQQHTALVAAVPTQPSAATIFSTVEALAADTGVSLSDITLAGAGVLATGSGQAKTPVHPSGTASLAFTVVIEGTSEAIRSFISRAGQVRRLLSIKSFDFTQSTPAQARLEMEAFYAPLPATIGSIDATIAVLTPQEESIIDQVASLPLLGQTLVLPAPLLGPTRPDPFTP